MDEKQLDRILGEINQRLRRVEHILEALKENQAVFITTMEDLAVRSIQDRAA